MSSGEVTQLLAAVSGGDAAAADVLMPMVYEELKRRASALMRREASHHTLQATALVHEAYVALVRQDQVSWEGRSHFFAIASQAMRRILIDHARGRLRQKRGDGAIQLELDEGAVLSPERDEHMVALDDALRRLAELDPRQADIVVMRYFGGLTVEEVAHALGMSKRSVEGDWTMAKAWLRHTLSGGE